MCYPLRHDDIRLFILIEDLGPPLVTHTPPSPLRAGSHGIGVSKVINIGGEGGVDEMEGVGDFPLDFSQKIKKKISDRHERSSNLGVH